MSQRVTIEVADGVAEVRLSRPDKRNALDLAMFEALGAAVDSLRGRDDVRAVLLYGEGPAFCAGIDLASFSGAGAAHLQNLEPRTHGIANLFQHAAWGWRELPVPVVAALHGFAFGGGMQIALGADIRIAAPDTRLSIMEIRWGLVPDMAGFPLLRGLVRDDIARELTYTGREVLASEGVSLGLVTRLADDPLAAGRALARQFADSSGSAMRANKRLFALAAQGDDAATLLAESREQQALLGSDEQKQVVARNLRR